MFCRRCGAQIPEASTFCTRCGAPLVFTGAPTVAGSSAPTLPGEQFTPPPAWQGPPPTWQGAPPPPPSGWAYPGGPAPYTPPPPSRPPLWDRLFGPRPQPGTPLNHQNRAQRLLFSRLQPSVASSPWLGAIIGSLFAFVLALLLSAAFSLTLGPTLDRSAFGTLNTSLNSSGLPSSNSLSFYTNPLMLLAYAHRSAFIVKVALNTSSSSLPGLNLNVSGSVSPPLTLLLLFPAIGLIFGGYLAASTNYTGRRLFSVTRGASIALIYALLVLIVSLVASTSTTIGDNSTSASLSINPEGLSAFLNALLWGLIFGTLGGYLHSRSLPRAAPARPRSRLAARIQGALKGTGIALAIHFALCLIVVFGLYILAQLGGPALRAQGSPASLSVPSTSTGSSRGNCSIDLQQPNAPSTTPTTPAVLSNDLATHVNFTLESPTIAFWVMSLSMGAPLALTSSGLGSSAAGSIGLFASDCGPSGAGAIFYFLLLLPAATTFVGGWFAARAAQARTAGEAAGVGLLMTAAITLLLLVITFFASLSLSITALGIGANVSLGPSIGGLLLAGLLFGAVLGMLGSVAGRPRNLPPLQPSAPSFWPAVPAGWPQAQQGPTQPVVSSAIASFPPASPDPGLAALGNQPTIVTPSRPEAQPPSGPTNDATGSADTTLQSP